MENGKTSQRGNPPAVPPELSLVPTDVPYGSSLLSRVCEGLSMRYPFVEIGSIGKSVMGRELLYLRLGEGEKEVFYNGAHHANEWITAPLLLKFLEDYAEAFARGGSVAGISASELFRAAVLYVVPLVDPDGADLVNGFVPEGRYLAAARRCAAEYPEIPFPSGWKANINGVDLNLQYPAGWERAKAIKFAQGCTGPAPRDFVGEAPLSEPESLAVYRFTEAHRFRLTLSYHSQGQVIYWKYADLEPPRSLELARHFASASGYSAEETPYESGFAGYKDWFIQTYDLPGYTVEVGLGESPLPLSQFGGIYRDNLGILVGGLKENPVGTPE